MACWALGGPRASSGGFLGELVPRAVEMASRYRPEQEALAALGSGSPLAQKQGSQYSIILPVLWPGSCPWTPLLCKDGVSSRSGKGLEKDVCCVDRKSGLGAGGWAGNRHLICQSVCVCV